MRDVIIFIMYAGIAGLAVEIWIVFANLRTKLHAYLLISCIATLINNIGYVLELSSTTEEAYINALKMSYLGRVFITYSLLMFAANLSGVRLKMIFSTGLLMLDVAVYSTVLTIGSNDLYYTDYRFDASGMFPVLHHGNGRVHHLFMQLQLFCIVMAFYWLIRALRREKDHNTRRRLWMVLSAFILECAFFLTQIFGLVPITKEFDISIFGNVVLTVFMFIAIFRYDLLGLTDLARDFMIDRLSEGVIAVDQKGKVVYFNDPAKKLYPQLSDEPDKVVGMIKEAISNGNTIHLNDRIYTPEENDLSDNGKSFGRIYSLVDSTVLKLKEYKLRADAEVLELAANTMRERLLTAEELMQQDRAMRHDRRHFEALLLSLLRDNKPQEAEKYLEERLAREPRSAARYCENATVNAALTHYAMSARNKNIKVNISTNIPLRLNMDEMQLAIAISNLFENAINACEALPEDERSIEITAKYKQQLLLEITNTCKGQVQLDEDGHPFATAEGHGIGTRSVLAFANQTGSEVRYIAEQGIFKVRMITG